jgi:para-nitrobenzyl esterase
MYMVTREDIMRTRIFACVTVCTMAAIAPTKADPITTSGGLVSGVLLPEGAVRAYKGIPFAKAPVGDLRWRAPQPASPWTETLVADKHRAVCMQPLPLGGNSIFTRLFFTPFEPRSEDCLDLNVWTSAPPADKRPVMVWIPSGGFRGGSAAGDIYDGAALAKKGVVLVSINYRVWKFGFLAHPELSKEPDQRVSGNYGLLDQIAALRWVRDNIAAFGGNPDNVTIFGQSAGSLSSNFLMASPLAKGLFHRVIGESGGAFAPAVPGSPLGRTLLTLADAEATGKRLMASLKATSLEDMRKRSADEILATPSADRYDSAVPIKDGYVIPGTMDDIFGRGRQSDVPLLIGSTSDEGSNFPKMGTLASFQEDARKTLGPFADEFLSVYKADNDTEARRANEAAVRDTRVSWSTLQWAKAQARNGTSKVFYYYFPHHPPAPPNEPYVEGLGKDLGAYHGAELAYVFGSFVPQEWAWTDADRGLEKIVSQYWVNFATSGDPNGPGLPPWPTFVPGTDSVLHFGTTIAPGPLPNQKYYSFWDKFATGWKGRE